MRIVFARPRPALCGVFAHAAVLLAAAGCSSLGVTSGQARGGAALPSPGVRGAAGPTLGPDSTFFGRTRDRRPQAAGGADVAVRRVCRSASRPRGWVAVAYERGGDECPARAAGDSTATAAVLVRLASRPIDTRLDVCADQPVPIGWSEVRDEAPGDPEACPGAARDGRSAVRRIRRTS